MDLSVNQKAQMEVGTQYYKNYKHISIEIENAKKTDCQEQSSFINYLKTDSKNETDCNIKSSLQGVTDNIKSTFEDDGEIFNYSPLRNALDLRIHCRNNSEQAKSIFDDAEYFAKNYLYKLLPITFETVDESVIQNEHNYCHSYESSESEAEGYCSRTMDFSQVREKNYKKRKTKAQEHDTDNEKGDNNKIHQNIVSFSSTFNTNCVADLVKENSSEFKSKPSQPLDLRAHLVQEKKTDICLNYSQHSVLNCNNNNNVEEKKSDIESDSDKENLKSKLRCIEVTITGPGKKESYQPCDLFLNDIARLAPKLIGKDCGELNILDKTCDRLFDVKKQRLYYIISETTWKLFQNTNERIILTNDRSLGESVEEKNSSEKPSFLVFDRYSLARYLADYCKEIGGCFEYSCVEDTKEDASDSVEVISTKPSQPTKEVKRCNDCEKETDITKISLIGKMENKTEKKVELNREDDGRRTDTFNCLEKNDKRMTPFITRADKNMDSQDRMNCSNSNPEPSCEDFDSFSSQTAVSQNDCKVQKDKPKCRRKCSDFKRKQRSACRRLNKKNIRKPKMKKCTSNSVKRSARKKCMAKKKSCQKGKNVVSRRSTRKSLRSMSKASQRKKSCASQRSTRSNVRKRGKDKKSGKGNKKRKRTQKCAFFNNIKRERPKACDLLKNSQFLKSGKLSSLKDAKKERPKVCELLKGENKCGGGSMKSNKKSIGKRREKGKLGKGCSRKGGNQKKSGRKTGAKIAKKGKSVKQGGGRGKSCGRKNAAKNGNAGGKGKGKGKSRVCGTSRGAKRGRSESRNARHFAKNKKLKKRDASKSAKRGRSGVRKCENNKLKKRNPSKVNGKQKSKVRGHQKYSRMQRGKRCKKTVVRKLGKHNNEQSSKRKKSVKRSESARSVKSKKSGESFASKGMKRKRSSTRACDDGDEAAKRKKSGRSDECGKAAKRKSSTHCSDVVRKRTRLEPKSSKKCGKSNKASGLKAKLKKKKEELKRRRQKKCHKRSESMNVKSRSQSSRGSCAKHQKMCHSGNGSEHKRKKKEGKDKCKRKR